MPALSHAVLALSVLAAAGLLGCLWQTARLYKARAAIALVERERRHFETTLNTMAQGVALFDQDERLLVSNTTYATMYGMDAQSVAAGTTLRSILEARAARGIYAGTTVDAILVRLRERLARRTVTHWTAPFADGRTIVVSTQPTADGSWVNTHLDITERERLREHLDVALTSMADGIAMFDADRKLILCNAQYAAIYKFPPNSVVPGMSLRDIIALGQGVGTLSGNEVEEFDNASGFLDASVKTGRHRINLVDGRFVDVIVTRTSHGGIVTCHRDVTDQCLSDARVAHLALHDALTELPNRVLLRERLDQALIRAQRSGEGVALHILDLDGFKQINDTMGHPVGDALLSEVANRLRKLVRATDTVARLGGDEFAIMQVGILAPDDAGVLGERAIRTLETPFQLANREVAIGVSIGTAIAPMHANDFDTLLRDADIALYRAKETGRGRLCFFDAVMDEDLRQKHALERDLRDAVHAGAFELHFQPLFAACASRINGFEALVRWPHATRGLIPPMDFLPLAERTGLIHDLTSWILREACSTALNWPHDIRVTVNISPSQLLAPDFLERVDDVLTETGLEAERLELEVKEAALNDPRATQILRSLKALGVRLSLDDFGSELSSLARLHLLNFNRLKIDPSLVQNSASSPILGALTLLARTLNLETTAEGIESDTQIAAVLDEGCTELQGFYLARPVPAYDIGGLLLQCADWRHTRRRNVRREDTETAACPSRSAGQE